MEKNVKENLGVVNQDTIVATTLELQPEQNGAQYQEQSRLRRYFKPVGVALAGLAMLGSSSVPASASEKTSPTTTIEMSGKPLEHAHSSTSTKYEKGPTQTNPLFAAHPTFAQNFGTYKKGHIDYKYWNVYQGAPPGNSEDEFYTNHRANIRVSGGSLVLDARQQNINPNYDYTSARVDTAGKEDFLYGKVVVNANMPDGIGTWPAIWLYPVGNKYEKMSENIGPDKYLNGGEMDIAEEIGANPNVVYSTVHTLGGLLKTNANGGDPFTKAHRIPGNNHAFNQYSLEWTPSSITMSIDNKVVMTYDKHPGDTYEQWPFNQRFDLILDLALGGTFGGADKAQFPPDGIDNASLPATMRVQSVYYYPYVGPKK